jgi:hypothetical protein
VELVCIDPARVGWPQVSPLLKAACHRNKLSAFADIEADLLQPAVDHNGRSAESAAGTILINSEVGKVFAAVAT